MQPRQHGPAVRCAGGQGGQQPQDLQLWIDIGPHGPDQAEHIRQAVHGEVLRLDGDQHLIGGDEGIGHQNAHGGVAVNKEIVVPVRDHQLQNIPQYPLPEHDLRQHRLCPGQTQGAGDVVDPAAAVPDQAVRGGQIQIACLGENEVRDGRSVIELMPQVLGKVALRIEVQTQDFLSQIHQPGRQIDGGSGLSHAALLIGDSDRFHFLVPP